MPGVLLPTTATHRLQPLVQTKHHAALQPFQVSLCCEVSLFLRVPSQNCIVRADQFTNCQSPSDGMVVRRREEEEGRRGEGA